MSQTMTSLAYSSAAPIHDVDVRLETVQAARLARTPNTADSGPGSPGKKKRKGKKKDGFSSTFGKIKALDPLAEENKKHMANMAKGFLELLDLHNTMELSSLCGMMGIRIERKTKNVEKKQFIMDLINKQIDEVGKPDVVYVNILKHMWEGTLFEYLRAKGQPLQSTENDPRGFLIAFWRKMTKTIVPFDPYYVPQTLTNRAKDDRRADDINAILDTMEQKEVAVKAAEVKIRREHDYTNVLTYLQTVSSLHNTEKEGRNYLIGEVEISRAKVRKNNNNTNAAPKKHYPDGTTATLRCLTRHSLHRFHTPRSPSKCSTRSLRSSRTGTSSSRALGWRTRRTPRPWGASSSSSSLPTRATSSTTTTSSDASCWMSGRERTTRSSRARRRTMSLRLPPRRD